MIRRTALVLLAAALGLAASLRAQNVAPQPTVIESTGPGEMVTTDDATTITFRDNVVVTGTNLRLSCDYLEVIVVRKGDATAALGQIDKFRSLIATGNVRITQGDREAACGRAEVRPGEDKIVLSESPVIVLKDEGSRLAGRQITLFRGQRRVIVDQPVSVLPPVKDLGADRDKDKAAKPAAPAPKP